MYGELGPGPHSRTTVWAGEVWLPRLGLNPCPGLLNPVTLQLDHSTDLPRDPSSRSPRRRQKGCSLASGRPGSCLAMWKEGPAERLGGARCEGAGVTGMACGCTTEAQLDRVPGPAGLRKGPPPPSPQVQHSHRTLLASPEPREVCQGLSGDTPAVHLCWSPTFTS